MRNYKRGCVRKRKLLVSKRGTQIFISTREHFSFRPEFDCMEFACFSLVVGNQNGALYLTGLFGSPVTLESTLHKARV